MIALSLVLCFASPAFAGEGKPSTKKAKIKKSKKEKKKSGGLRFGGAAGAGFDSNAYRRADKDTASGSTDLAADIGYDLKRAKLAWISGFQLGGAFRFGDKSAAKVRGKLKSGVNLVLFGDKSLDGGKKKGGVAGTLSLGVKYGFSANPVIETIDEGVPVEEMVDDYVLDPEVEELLDEEDFDEDEDFGDDFSDEDVAEEDEAGEEAVDEVDAEEDLGEDDGDVDDFADQDLIGGTSFGLTNPKHDLGANAKLAVDLWKGGVINLSGTFARAMVSADEGKPSGDSTQLGGKLGVEQTMGPVKLGADYGIARRSFDEKVTKDLDGVEIPLVFLAHSPGASVKVKLGSLISLKLGYRYGLRLADQNPTLDSFRHQLRLDGRIKITKSLAGIVQTGFGLSGKVDDPDRDSSRFQGLAGLQFKI